MKMLNIAVIVHLSSVVLFMNAYEKYSYVLSDYAKEQMHDVSTHIHRVKNSWESKNGQYDEPIDVMPNDSGYAVAYLSIDEGSYHEYLRLFNQRPRIHFMELYLYQYAEDGRTENSKRIMPLIETLESLQRNYSDHHLVNQLITLDNAALTDFENQVIETLYDYIDYTYISGDCNVQRHINDWPSELVTACMYLYNTRWSWLFNDECIRLFKELES